MSKQVEDVTSKRKAAPGSDGENEEVLNDRVADKLGNIFGTGTNENLEVDDELEDDDELEEEEESGQEEEDDDSDDDHEEDDDSDDGDDREEDDEDDEEESSTSGKKEEDLEPVPQAYIQAAKAYGWSDKKIERMLRMDRETALDTLAGIYDTRNKINAHYSAMGRQAKQNSNQKQDAGPKVPTIDEAALEDALGKEEAAPVIALLKQQNEAIAAMQPSNEPAPQDTALLPDIDTRYQNAVEESGVEQQLNMFFEADSMKAFKEVYGTMNIGETWDDLPAGQRKHRWAVLQKADSIIGGAKLQGRQVPIQEALLDAHLLVTQKYRDKITVDGIRKKVVKRSKGRTLKPSKSRGKTKANSGRMKNGKRTEAQLLQDTQASLNKIFR